MDEQQYEYEFSFRHDGQPSFVTLWDTNDLSACQRALCENITPEQIVISEQTGNGFIRDSHGNSWTFHKEPYQKSWETHADIRAGVQEDLSERPIRRRQVQTPEASDILAGL